MSLKLWDCLLILGFCIIILIFVHPATKALQRAFLTPLNNTRDPRIVVYNRVPKTGGTSLVRIFEYLSSSNHFRVYQINISDPDLFLNPLNHKAFVEKVSSTSHDTNLLIQGHFYHINFHKYGILSNYVYINILRDPLERLVSIYYYLRFGDDYLPEEQPFIITNDSSKYMTFDECVNAHGHDCQPKSLWTQIPFFCGSFAYCKTPGNRQALETAKRRLTEEYLLVGVLEYFDEFVELLSRLLPNYLNGIESTKHLSIDNIPLWHLRRTNSKAPIEPQTKEYFRKDSIWQMEQEFYEFAKAEFVLRYNNYKQELFDQNKFKNDIFLLSV